MSQRVPYSEFPATCLLELEAHSGSARLGFFPLSNTPNGCVLLLRAQDVCFSPSFGQNQTLNHVAIRMLPGSPWLPPSCPVNLFHALDPSVKYEPFLSTRYSVAVGLAHTRKLPLISPPRALSQSHSTLQGLGGIRPCLSDQHHLCSFLQPCTPAKWNSASFPKEATLSLIPGPLLLLFP